MKIDVSNVFEIEIPDGFEIRSISKIGVRAEKADSKFDVQCPFLEARLFLTSDLNSSTYIGETLEEKFEDWCLSSNFKAEKLDFKETKFNEFKTLLFHSYTDAAWQKTHFKLRYFHAVIFLDDEFFLEYKAIHEKIPSGELDSWAAHTLETIGVTGDAEQRKQAWAQHLLDVKAEIREQDETLRTTAEVEKEEKKKEFCRVTIPVDGKEFFKVGNYDFEFVPDEYPIHIPEFSGQLIVNIKAKTSNIDAATKAELLDDYEKDGIVKITVPAKGIHVKGIPTGQLYFEEERTATPFYLTAISKGFDYRLAFNGSVTFNSGWLLLKGEMTKSYHDKTFPIQIAKKIDTSSLNWKNYQFISFEETETANPKDIRFLALNNPVDKKLPEGLFTYENLEHLTISLMSSNWENEKLSLSEIPLEIGRLRQLKKLYINGASLEKLPESISELKALENLSISNCILKSVPKGIWKLPKLKYLWLSSNELEEIPEDINLPELQNLSLEKNQLKTLPEALAKQPKLKKISLKDNPLEHLPNAFNEVETIELSMEDKKRLLNFDYQGADGKGSIQWNNDVFWSQSDADLIAKVDEVLKENELKKHTTALRSLVKKGIGFQHTSEDDYARLGNHRFGGMPDLPKEMEYPEFYDDYNKESYKYEFIGQINCEKIANLQEYLPRKGMLYFFFESIHMIYGGTNNPCKVIYAEDTSNLISGKRFDFDKKEYYEMLDGGYEAYSVVAKKVNSAPSLYSSYVNKHLFIDREELEQDRKFLDDAYNVFEEPLAATNSFEYQYAVGTYGFSQHEHPELQASLRKKGNPEDWLILLTVTSSGDMQWGDAGDLFFVIHKSDLAKCDFSNVFVTMESS